MYIIFDTILFIVAILYADKHDATVDTMLILSGIYLVLLNMNYIWWRFRTAVKNAADKMRGGTND